MDDKPSTLGVKNPRSSPRRTTPTYYTYEQSDRSDTLWNSRLNKKWTPKPITEQHNFLNLDCVTDTNKTIQLWIGYISKQLIDNKIAINETPSI